MYPKVFVVVINWNGKHMLKQCLDSLMKQTYKNFEIILVDNGSSDDSVWFVKENYPSVIVIQLDKNYGFAEANNMGFRFAIKENAKYIAILNNDAYADREWLSEMVAVAESDTRIGSCAPKILRYHNHTKIDTCGSGLFKNCMPFGIGSDKPAWKYNKQTNIFGINGAAALLRVSMLEDIKLDNDYFDSDYFSYQEEFDLSWRAQLRNWKSVFIPSAIVYHLGSATGRKIPKLVKYYLERNRLWTLIKNIQLSLFFDCLPNIIFYELISIPYYIFSIYFLSVLKGRLDAIRSLKKMLRKRKIIQHRTCVSSEHIKKIMIPRFYDKCLKAIS